MEKNCKRFSVFPSDFVLSSRKFIASSGKTSLRRPPTHESVQSDARVAWKTAAIADSIAERSKLTFNYQKTVKYRGKPYRVLVEITQALPLYLRSDNVLSSATRLK